MKRIKTLCLLENDADLGWLADYRQRHASSEDIVVAAYGFFGRVAARGAGLPCVLFDKQSQHIDPFATMNVSRYLSMYWRNALGERHDQPPLVFKGYPLGLMHQFNVMTYLNFLLPSLLLARHMLDQEKPDKVLMGWRENPFEGRQSIHITVGPDGGFERECLRTLCQDAGIEVLCLGRPPESSSLPVVEEIEDECEDASVFTRLEQADIQELWSHSPAPGYADPDDFDPGTKPCFLFFAYGYFHLDDLLSSIDSLLARAATVVVINIGGDIEPEVLDSYTKRGVLFFRKESFRLEDEEKSLRSLVRLFGRHAHALTSRPELESFFRLAGDSFHRGLAEHILDKDIRNMPYTILELLRTEAILSVFRPQAVFVHFSVGCYHGWGSYDALPARKAGIPTLSFDHGINGVLGASLSLPTTEYHAAYGECTRRAIMNYTGFNPEKIRAVGNPRYERFSQAHDRRAEKRRLGLDPDKPVVVFCSTSEVMGQHEYRHATYDNITAIMDLKRRFPQAQIIYRVHHGLDYSGMRRFFQELGMEGLSFEISLEQPHPILADLLKGADALISQAASCLTEAMILGTPVIYYCARANVDPLYLGNPLIRVASTDEDLALSLRHFLDSPPRGEDAERARHEFLACAAQGNDGRAGERMADFLFDILRAPSLSGWEDWIACTERQCLRSFGIAVDPSAFNLARSTGLGDREAHARALEAKRAAATEDAVRHFKPGDPVDLHPACSLLWIKPLKAPIPQGKAPGAHTGGQ